MVDVEVRAPSAPQAPQAMLLQPGEGESIAVGPNQITYKVTGEQTGGLFSAIEYTVAPHFQAPPVLHTNSKESWAGYVLEGRLGFQLGERHVLAPAGSFLYCPKDAPFKWWNDLDSPARVLFMYLPAGFEMYFKELTEVLNDLPQPLNISKAMPRIMPLWEKYGNKRLEE